MSRPAPLLRIASQWVLGALLAVALAALFLALNAFQLTSEGTGQRLLRRAVAVTTGIDALLPAVQEELREAARESEGEEVRVPGFPIPVELTREEALSLSGPALRARILKEAARRLYDEGMSAWAEGEPPGEQDVEAVSTAGALHQGLGLITEENHTRILIALVVLAAISLALAALLLAAVSSWYGRLIALAGVTLVAALPSLAAAVAVRFGFRTAQEEADPFVDGLLELGVQAMGLLIRNYLTLSALAFAVLAVAMGLVWAAGRAGPSPPSRGAAAA